MVIGITSMSCIVPSMLQIFSLTELCDLVIAAGLSQR